MNVFAAWHTPKTYSVVVAESVEEVERKATARGMRLFNVTEMKPMKASVTRLAVNWSE